MKSFVNLQTNKFVQSTLTTINGFKKNFATVTSVQANLQPLSAQKTNLVNGVMGKTYKMVIDSGEDVNDGDRFREIATGKFYKVINGGTTRRSFGSMDYTELIVTETN